MSFCVNLIYNGNFITTITLNPTSTCNSLYKEVSKSLNENKESIIIRNIRGLPIIYSEYPISGYLLPNSEINVENIDIQPAQPPPPPFIQSDKNIIPLPANNSLPKENKFIKIASNIQLQNDPLNNYKFIPLIPKYYKILTEIPSCGCSSVYIVDNIQNHANEVMKVYNIKSIREEKVNQFKSLLNTVNRLNTTNIVKYYNIEDDSEYLLFIMKKYESSLSPLNSNIDVNKFDILNDIYTAVSFFHLNNLIHGNIKPSNILIDCDNHYYLSDYCVDVLIKQGSMINMESISYLSPEVLQNKEISRKSDIWSVGCVSYYVISNSEAFEGNSIVELINKIVNCRYKRFGGDFSKELNGFINRMLIKEPEKRVNITDLIKELGYISSKPYCVMKESTPLYLIDKRLYELIERLNAENLDKIEELIEEVLNGNILMFNNKGENSEHSQLLQIINSKYTSLLLYYPLYQIYLTVNKHFGKNTTIIECNPILQRWILFKSFKLNPSNQLKSMYKCPLVDIENNEITKLKDYYQFKKPSDELILCYIIGKEEILLNDKESQWNKYHNVFSDIIEKINELGPIEVIENIINKTLHLLQQSSLIISKRPKEHTGMTDLLFNNIQKIYDEFDESMNDRTLGLKRFNGMDKYFEEYSTFCDEMIELKKRQKQMNYNKIKRELSNIKSGFEKDFEEENNIEGIDDDAYDLLKKVEQINETLIDYNQILDRDARIYLECSHFLYSLEVTNTVSAIVQYYDLLRELDISKDKLIHDFDNYEKMKKPLEVYITARINYYAKTVNLNDYYLVIKQTPFYIHKSITQEEIDNAMDTLLENDWISGKKRRNEKGETILDFSHITDKCSTEYYEDKLDLQALKIIRYVREERERELDLHKILSLEPYNYTSKCEAGTIVSSSDLKYEYQIRNYNMKNKPLFYIYEGIYNSTLPFHDKLLLICPFLHNQLSEIVIEILTEPLLRNFFKTKTNLQSIDDIIPKADEYFQNEYKNKSEEINQKIKTLENEYYELNYKLNNLQNHYSQKVEKFKRDVKDVKKENEEFEGKYGSIETIEKTKNYILTLYYHESLNHMIEKTDLYDEQLTEYIKSRLNNFKPDSIYFKVVFFRYDKNVSFSFKLHCGDDSVLKFTNHEVNVPLKEGWGDWIRNKLGFSNRYFVLPLSTYDVTVEITKHTGEVEMEYKYYSFNSDYTDDSISFSLMLNMIKFCKENKIRYSTSFNSDLIEEYLFLLKNGIKINNTSNSIQKEYKLYVYEKTNNKQSGLFSKYFHSDLPIAVINQQYNNAKSGKYITIPRNAPKANKVEMSQLTEKCYEIIVKKLYSKESDYYSYISRLKKYQVGIKNDFKDRIEEINKCQKDIEEVQNKNSTINQELEKVKQEKQGIIKPISIQSKVYIPEKFQYKMNKQKLNKEKMKLANVIFVTNIKGYEFIIPEDDHFQLPPFVKSRSDSIITIPIINPSNIDISVKSKKCHARITPSSELEIMIDNPEPPEMDIPIILSIPNKSIIITVKFEVKEFDELFFTNYQCGIDENHPNRLIYTCKYKDPLFEITWFDGKGKHTRQHNRGNNNSTIWLDERYSIHYVSYLNQPLGFKFVGTKGKWKLYNPNKESPINSIVGLPKDIVDVDEKLNQIQQNNSLTEYVNGLKNIFLCKLSNNEDVTDKVDQIISYLYHISINKDIYLKSVYNLVNVNLQYINTQNHPLIWKAKKCL